MNTNYRIKSGPGPFRSMNDARRLVHLDDACSIVGTGLYRWGVKSLPAVGVTTLALVGLSTQTDTSTYKALSTALVSVVPMTAGMSLKFLPLLWVKNKNLAEGNDLNLMKDYKSSRLEHHLEHLWDNVYRFESTTLYTGQQRSEEQSAIAEVRDRYRSSINEECTYNDEALEILIAKELHSRRKDDSPTTTKDGFICSAAYSIRSKRSQNMEHDITGFDLSAYENWLDGAPFHENDTKLAEQYMHDIDLREVRSLWSKHNNQGKRTKAMSKGVSTAHTFWQNRWRHVVKRKLGILVGSSLGKIHELYPTSSVNAQTLLWPGDENTAAITKHEGLSDLVLDHRKQIVHTVFGTNKSDAHTLIDRMFFPNFARAYAVRQHVDVEYVLNELGSSAIDDLREYGCKQRCIKQTLDFKEETSREANRLEDHLESHGDLNAEQIRAVRVAHHMNVYGLRDVVRNNSQHTSRIISDVTNEAEKFTKLLVAVRLHHELTKIQLAEYQNLIAELGYSEQVA